ncbi:hypothetical protein [Pseudarthrobacter sp. H2]|uniref:hypothetical protein n=1 Tax=Pseudarthrobacter sp. H2 TaxID=3418415 RepID=UPI003CEC6536
MATEVERLTFLISPVKPYPGVRIADYGQGSQQNLSGVRVDGGIVVIMTEERDW